MPKGKKKKTKQSKQKKVPAKVTKKVIEKVAKNVAAREKARGYAPGLLGGLGTAAGMFLGGAPGAAIGGSLGTLFGKVTGMGAYHVKTNTLMNPGASVPTFGEGGGCTMAHREFIGDVSGSVAFTNTTYSINPGLSNLFPWLSLCAQQFEEYQMLGMIIEFKSTSATALNSTNTALGTVIMATNYDSHDANFQNKQQMESYQYSTSAAPSVSQLHPIECDPRKNVMKNLFVRTGSVPTGADSLFYDVGVFQLATVGMQAAAVIGELWVTYHVKFLRPRLPVPVGSNVLAFHYVVSLPSSWSLITSPPSKLSGSTLTMAPGTQGTNTCQLVITGPQGRYFMAVVTSGSTPGGIGMSVVGGSTVAVNAINTSSSTVGLTGGSTAMVILVFDTLGPSGIVNWTYSNSGTANVDFFCFQMPSMLSLPALSLEDQVARLTEQIMEMKALSTSSPPSTPHTECEDDLTSSVHLSREDVRTLLGRRHVQ